MPELTDAGRDAMARELLHIATDGTRTWERETPKLRAEFQAFVDQMLVKAREAEDERIQAHQPRRGKGVLP
jgi:hypothetical protein